MRLLQLSLKEILFINAILSLCICALGGSYLYSHWQNHQHLVAKLHQLNLPVKVLPARERPALSNINELIQYLKEEPTLKVKLLTSSQEADGLHLKFSGTLEHLTRLINMLASSALKEVSLEQDKEGYALNLNLINLRLYKFPVTHVQQKTVAEKIIGSVTLRYHHYCVIKGVGQKTYLKEQSQC